MPSKPYDPEILRFYMAGYRHIRNSNVIPSLWSSDTGYIDESMDASEPYDAKLLRPRPEFVYTLVWMMPGSLETRTFSAYMSTSAPLT